MSRRGSMTRPTPRSASATRKLVLPSSGAGTASTVNIALAERERRRGQEDVDGEEHDHDRATVEDGLRREALGSRDAEVDQQVAQAVREVEERHGDEDQQVELDDGVAEHAEVVRLHDLDHAERSEDALQHDVHGEQDRGDHPALGEHEPPEEVHERGSLWAFRLLSHRASHNSRKPITTVPPTQRANCDATIRRGEMGRSNSLRWMIDPARLRKVTVW